jgi:hypothetical protein
VSDDARDDERAARDSQVPPLPEHLSVLVGSLHGPADLGRNHDKYLTYADRDDADGVASA